jgi:two-component system sensor histidine kinase VicK
LEKTENMISAMAGKRGIEKHFWTDYIDYAVPLSGESGECIIYIKDSQEETKSFSFMILQITMQALLVGLAVALVLSFFLARAITSPIQSLTKGVQKIENGEFENEIRIYSDDEIGMLTNAFNHMKDVLKNTLDEITGERQKFETLFMYLNDAVLAFDNGGHMIHVNKTACTLFSLNAEGVMKNGETLSFSQMLTDLKLDYNSISEKYKETRNCTVQDIVFGEKALDITFAEFRYIEKNKEKRGVMCVMHDITERYELDKSRREFVANVSHELRTPLTGIKGAVETVLEYPTLDTALRDQFLGMAVEECDRMTRIVSDLLTLSRFDNDGTVWKIETFESTAFLDRVYDVMRTDAKNRGHSFIKNYSQSLPPVTGDKEKLQQVLINVLSNAMKYTEPGGEISLEAHEDKNGIAVFVSDNGIGIPKEDIPRLFERFYCVEKARSSESGGTGLGLAIAKEIMNAHGGEIEIESELGEGTKVRILLPYEPLLGNEEK